MCNHRSSIDSKKKLVPSRFLLTQAFSRSSARETSSRTLKHVLCNTYIESFRLDIYSILKICLTTQIIYHKKISYNQTIKDQQLSLNYY